MKGEYLIVLAATLFFPLILSRDKNLAIWKRRSALWKAILTTSVPFWIWDVIVTARGHWTFNEQYILGVTFIGMPMEEWLFFLVVAFVSIFTWESVKYFAVKK